MVRTPTELHVYWRPAGGHHHPRLVLRITDLTGRPRGDLLDGCGFREVEAAESTYVPNLLPGHLYLAEVGTAGPEGFCALLSVGPVQTPGLAAPVDSSDYPAPYHRS
jgi:hypothetical protein